MNPSRSDDAVVDLLDAVLRDGVVVRAEVVVTVADVPLVGIDLSAAVAGMTTMTRYGLLEDVHIDSGEDGEGSDEPPTTRATADRRE